MKNNKHIQGFNEHLENSNDKEQLRYFLDYVRRYHVSSIPMDRIDYYVDSYLNSVEKDDVFIKMMSNK